MQIHYNQTIQPVGLFIHVFEVDALRTNSFELKAAPLS